MRLHSGDLVPVIRVEDIRGRNVDIPSGNDRFLLLSFFRNAKCAICNFRLAQMMERFPTYQRSGLDVVALFESAPERVREQFRERHVPFPIIADPDAALYDRFDVETSEEKVARTMARPDLEAVIGAAAAAGFPLTPEEGNNAQRIPADFLIGPDGIVLVAHYGEYVFDHLPFDEIEREVGALVAV